MSTSIEREPAIATELFGDRIDRARTFFHELADRGELLGLIGPLEIPRLWTRHIINCALLAPLLRPGKVGDIGSGAGLPGMVLAIARPDVEFVLIEPMERRTQWLTEQRGILHLDNVKVVRARAEDVEPREFDQVTARAVSSLRKLIPIAAPLLQSGGEMVLMKGRRVAEERDAASKAIARARLRDVRIDEVGVGTDVETTHVFRASVP